MDRRLTPRGEERRRQLMAVAAHLFATNGYHPTSVAEIVDALGVGKGVFYWYFSAKDDLMVAILEDAQRDLRRCQRHAIGDEPDPVRRIELGIRASMAWSAEHRDLITLFQFAATEKRFAPTLRRGQEVALADAVRHIKEGIVEGRIRDMEPTVLAQAVIGVTTQLSMVYIHRRGEPATQVAEAAVAFCLEGLRGGRAQGVGATQGAG